MPETLPRPESKGEEFLEEVVYLRRGESFEDYLDRRLETYRTEAPSVFEQTGKVLRLWTRLNEDSSMFTNGKLIGYLLPRPSGEGFGILATLDIDDYEINVRFPADDGSGEPILASKEPYSVEALERAIALVEETC